MDSFEITYDHFNFQELCYTVSYRYSQMIEQHPFNTLAASHIQKTKNSKINLSLFSFVNHCLQRHSLHEKSQSKFVKF